jgi:nucleoside-diphosphate-sugar epimerase
VNRPVIVTGAFGSLGIRVVATLLARGEDVVAVDLRNPATERAAATVPAARPAWVDVTDPVAAAALIAATDPKAVLHLAGAIPPRAYAAADLARRVNVDGTRNVVTALEELTTGCRLVLASSLAVYGSRNGGRDLGLLDADTPLRPRDCYGEHKVAAEHLVRESGLDWAILRLGGIISSDLVRRTDRSAVLMEAIVPSDSRIHTVYVDDAAEAFATAVDAPCSGRTLMVCGDDSHRLRQDRFTAAMLSLAGLGPWPGIGNRRGNPHDDDAWFITDWADTRQAQELLAFQRHTFDQAVSACRAELSPWRRLLVVFAALARVVLFLVSPYRRAPGAFADPWAVIERRWGPDAVTSPPTMDRQLSGH